LVEHYALLLCIYACASLMCICTHLCWLVVGCVVVLHHTTFGVITEVMMTMTVMILISLSCIVAAAATVPSSQLQCGASVNGYRTGGMLVNYTDASLVLLSSSPMSSSSLSLPYVGGGITYPSLQGLDRLASQQTLLCSNMLSNRWAVPLITSTPSLVERTPPAILIDHCSPNKSNDYDALTLFIPDRNIRATYDWANTFSDKIQWYGCL
jgi:hypothetical protein